MFAVAFTRGGNTTKSAMAAPGLWLGPSRLLKTSQGGMTECLKLCFFGPLLQESNPRLSSHKMPYHAVYLIWRLLTQAS